MSLRTLSHILADAEAEGYGVGAFNVSDLNQAIAVLDAAQRELSPVIVQAIAGMHAYDNESKWWSQLHELVANYEDVPAALHLDHGRTLEDCSRAIDHGFTSVMIDASRRVLDNKPTTFEQNVELTRAVVDLAKASGVSTEGEIGTVGGAEAGEGAETEEIVFADPKAALRFVESTGVDALAVAVGTSHGAVKFTTPEGGARLNIPLIAKIKALLPDTYLVLHGSSSIPRDAVRAINGVGGRLRESYGVSKEQKQEGIRHGIRKINQGTDSHLVWTAALREFLSAQPSVVEPSEYLKPAVEAMSILAAQRMREFGCAGRAG